MNESIAAALSVVRHRSKTLGIAADFYQKTDLHIHLPEGATPKDGPSAGGAIVTAIVSILTGIPVRADVAMTGEITLRGEVLPIGGLKEKLLAAGRGGIKTVLIPEENVKDLTEIPDEIKNRLEIRPVRWIEEVLEAALERQPAPLPETPRRRRRQCRRRRDRRSAGADQALTVDRSRSIASRDLLRVVGDHVNKSDLIDAIARHADISKAAAGRALDALTELDHRRARRRAARDARRLRFVLRRQAHRAAGPQPADRRGDQDPGCESARSSALAKPSRMR